MINNIVSTNEYWHIIDVIRISKFSSISVAVVEDTDAREWINPAHYQYSTLIYQY